MYILQHISGALSTFSHAHEYLLEKDCIVVPDSAVIYAQVVECLTLWKWNKLNDLADSEFDIILRTPQKVCTIFLMFYIRAIEMVSG